MVDAPSVNVDKDRLTAIGVPIVLIFLLTGLVYLTIKYTFRFSLIESIVFVVFFMFAVGWTPVYTYLFGPGVAVGRTVFAKMLWLIGAFCYGATVFELGDDNEYRARVARKNSDGNVEIYKNGHWVELDGPRKYLKRLSFRPFGLTWEKNEDNLTGVQVEGREGAYAADGGEEGEFKLLDRRRGGFRLFDPYVNDDDGYVVDMVRVWERLQQSGQPYMMEEAKRAALQGEAHVSKYRDVIEYVMLFLTLIAGFVLVWFAQGGL